MFEKLKGFDHYETQWQHEQSVWVGKITVNGGQEGLPTSIYYFLASIRECYWNLRNVIKIA
jgi:hypothetical protein